MLAQFEAEQTLRQQQNRLTQRHAFVAARENSRVARCETHRVAARFERDRNDNRHVRRGCISRAVVLVSNRARIAAIDHDFARRDRRERGRVVGRMIIVKQNDALISGFRSLHRDPRGAR